MKRFHRPKCVPRGSGLSRLVAVLTLAGLAGCGPRETGERAQTSPSSSEASANVADVLRLMPDSAITALATPSLRVLDERVEGFLSSASPASINMEAEIRVVIQQLGRMVDVSDARTLEDIAMETGIDAEKPLAVFIAASLSGPDVRGAVAAYCTDTALAEQALLRLSEGRPSPEAGQPFESTELPEAGVVLHARADGSLSYFLQNSLIVFGIDTEMVREVAVRLRAPMAVRYGREPFPASEEDRIVQLTRLDRVAQQAGAGKQAPGAPEGANTNLAESIAGMTDAYAGDDPLVTTWRISDQSLDVISRLDCATHPKAAAWLGEPHPLRHLGLLPKDSVAVFSLGFAGALREAITHATEGIVQDSVEPATPLGDLPQTAGEALEILGDTVTLCVTGGEGQPPVVTLLAELQQGDEARRKFRELGLTSLVSETYNGVDVYLLPAPVPAGDGIHCALPGSTMAVSTDLSELKSSIDRIQSNRQSSWAGLQKPPINPQEPQFNVLLAKHAFLSGTLLPTLESRGAVSPDAGQTAGLIWEKLDEIRWTTRVIAGCQEARISLRVR